MKLTNDKEVKPEGASDFARPAGAPPARRPRSSGAGLAIEVEGLTHKYGELVAVDNLSLSVPAGSLFGFLGPNGAGKSTTIRCLTGELDATGGRVEVLGEPLTRGGTDLKRRIGVMPEGLALFDHLYAQEFLTFNARMFGLDEATTRRRVEELLEVMDLTGASRKRLADYSTGMRKKVALAAAIIHRPEILFLDEPFEGIDPAAVAMFKDWLRRYAAGGGTVFMTSHVLETVERLCDGVAIIKAGQLVWRGEVGRLPYGGTIELHGQQFGTLEELFLHLVGGQRGQLGWL